MNNDDNKFRSIGSAGLVIFERDGTLLRRNNPPRDFMLGDISNEFVQMLQQLREMNVRFGFISDARGMDAGSHGRSEFAALIGLLDELLCVRRAMPDFWMAWSGFPQGIRSDRRRRVGAEMILRAIEWYGIQKKETIMVTSTAAGLFAANVADVMSIKYSGLRSDRSMPHQRETEPQFPSPSMIVDPRRLRVEIQRILGLSRRRSA